MQLCGKNKHVRRGIDEWAFELCADSRIKDIEDLPDECFTSGEGVTGADGVEGVWDDVSCLGLDTECPGKGLAAALEAVEDFFVEVACDDTAVTVAKEAGSSKTLETVRGTLGV